MICKIFSNRFSVLVYVYHIFLRVIAENWKAKQATIAMKWGTTGYEDEERERAEYEGIEIPSPVDGQPMLYYSSSNQFFVRLFINVCQKFLVYLRNVFD